MRQKYSHEEKLQYLKEAYHFVQSGQGTVSKYTALAGLCTRTYYQWLKKYADEAGVPVKGRIKKPNQALVAIGRPKAHVASSTNQLTVEFFESKISIKTEEELVVVLKAVKRAAI